MLIGDTQHDTTREERYAQMLYQKQADGLIFLGHRLPMEAWRQARAQRSMQRPMPIVNGCEFSRRLGVPSVHIDNARAATEAMDHLYSLGHRRVAVVTGPLVSPLSRDRLRGAIAGARAAGARKHLVVVNGDFSISSGTIAATRLLARRPAPTAVFCFNDEMATADADRAPAGYPRSKTSVVGFDDPVLVSRSPLTTITQPMREIGEGCAPAARNPPLPGGIRTLQHQLTSLPPRRRHPV